MIKIKQKVKISALATLTVFLMIILFPIPLISAETITHTDPEDDVLRLDPYNPFSMQWGDFMDGIDILEFKVDGNNFNITFVGNSGEGMTYQILFFIGEYNPLTTTMADYAIMYMNWSQLGLFNGLFVKFITEITMEVWNGTEWTADITNGTSVGSITGKTFSATVPPSALNITSSTTYFAGSIYMDIYDLTYIYMDYCPNDFSPYQQNSGSEETLGVPGYDLFILFGSLLSVSILLIKKRRDKS